MGIDRQGGIARSVQSALQRVESAGSKAVHSAGQAVKDVARATAQSLDRFEPSSAPLSGAGRAMAAKPPDTQYDGQFIGASGKAYPPGTPLAQIPAFTPAPGTPPKPEANETFIYVNGIRNTKDDEAATLQDVANATGGRVIGIHNATEGGLVDLAQALGDKLDKGRNPAVDTLADTVYGELKAGRSVHLMGHSQGALITSRALNHVLQRLQIEDGMSKADAEKLMSNVKVETFGGAAAHYPDGPQYVHYCNRSDVAPGLLGLDLPGFLTHAGRDAVVRHFDSHEWNKFHAHSMDQTYLPQRLPFDEARQLGSS